MTINSKGQNVVEYIIAVAAIVLILIAFLGPGSRIATTVNDSLNTSIDAFIKVAEDLNIENRIEIPDVGDDGGGIIIPPECQDNPRLCP